MRVFDATGAQLPATWEVTAGATRLAVDGPALARAVYPVTSDPEIGANDFRLSDMGPDGSGDFGAFDPALAYNSLNNEYLGVWEGDDATENEFEIIGQRFSGGVPPPPPPGVVSCLGAPATLIGTEGNDVLRGTAQRDVIHGLGGNDTIRGLGGNDRLCGGTGRDRLFGGGGKDRLDGGPGTDVCNDGRQRDRARGCEVQKTSRSPRTDDSETLIGTPGNDVLRGLGGNDVLCGGDGRDRLFGGAGRDALNRGTGRDRCDGGGGTDTARRCEVRVRYPDPWPDLRVCAGSVSARSLAQ